MKAKGLCIGTFIVLSVILVIGSICYFAQRTKLTIDKETLTQKCYDIMKSTGNELNFCSVQVAVLDVETGELLTWSAMKKQGDSLIACQPMGKSCSRALIRPIYAIAAMGKAGISLDDEVDTKSGVDSIDGIVIHDYNWEQDGYHRIPYLTAIVCHSDIGMYHAMREGFGPESAKQEWGTVDDSLSLDVDPVKIATLYASIANNGITKIPDWESGIVTETNDEEFLTPNGLSMIKGALSMEKTYAIYRGCLSYEPHWLAYAKSSKIRGGLYEEAFAGYFPLHNPKYSICIVAHKEGLPATSSQLKGIVVPLSDWLLQRMP